MRRVISLVFMLLAATLFVSPASARALEQERHAGLVGDQADGYLGVVQGGNGALQKSVDEINIGRREEYARIAGQQGTSPDAVGAIFGEKLWQQTGSGEYFRGANGAWLKKP